MKKFLFMILLLTTGCVIDMYAQSQTIEVTGMVRDAEKIPLAGVNISVKNVAGLGVITNIDGEYKIKIAPYSTLIFSYIGFETQEVPIRGDFAKEIREKIFRVNTGKLNKSDKSEIVRTKKELKRFAANWK